MAEFAEDEPGVAKIKAEFKLVNYKPKLEEEYVSEKVKEQIEDAAVNDNVDGESGPPAKRVKLKGRNKQRPKFKKIDAALKLCPAFMQEKECNFGERCKFSHNKQAILDAKPADIGPECHLFETYGKCPYGVACRYARAHLSEDLSNTVKDDIADRKPREKTVTNVLIKDNQVALWKRRYDFSKTDAILEIVSPGANVQKKFKQIHKSNKNSENVQQANKSENVNEDAASSVKDSNDSKNVSTNDKQSETQKTAANNGQQASNESVAMATLDHGDEGVIRLRSIEKKKIDFKDKLYLAPLTTVGNLPFRRICKGLGADITCGEMAVCTNLLQGQQSEWALLKRHESEDLFGVQLCGAYPDSMTRCAQLISETMEVDFIDINCGCPIELIFNKGEGSALMGRVSKFEQIVKGMTAVLDVPLTVKVRTGIYSHTNIAHTLMPKLKMWDVALCTVHGRSRVQRYTRLADWDYINECAKAADPMPVFGNGDILSFEDANLRREQTGVSGLMLARGALIKPWLFTEIKEQRHWDISATERLDLLKDYTKFGLDHWGSDHQGVENTRRFLLEWLSFLYRYIPVGVLDRIPQQINERPPYYKGRNELETLMASPSCGDWIKISEMLLGPVPQGFVFLPKHKANAYK